MAARMAQCAPRGSGDGGGKSWGYLRGAASYGQGGCLLDSASQPVMMPWEGGLMEAHAARFVGPRVLNVGFGCGLVDAAVERLVPGAPPLSPREALGFWRGPSHRHPRRTLVHKCCKIKMFNIQIH